MNLNDRKIKTATFRKVQSTLMGAVETVPKEEEWLIDQLVGKFSCRAPEIHAIYEVFQAHKGTKDGITKDKFCEISEGCPEMLQKRLFEIQTNNGDVMNFQQFFETIYYLTNRALKDDSLRENKYRLFFRLLDRNDKGFISKDDLQIVVMESLSKDTEVGPLEIAQIIDDTMNLFGSDTITWDSFYANPETKNIFNWVRIYDNLLIEASDPDPGLLE